MKRRERSLSGEGTNEYLACFLRHLKGGKEGERGNRGKNQRNALGRGRAPGSERGGGEACMTRTLMQCTPRR